MIDEQYLTDIITAIRRDRQGRQPDIVLMGEIAARVIDDMRHTLRDMTRSGKLRCRRTINDVGFTTDTS